MPLVQYFAYVEITPAPPEPVGGVRDGAAEFPTSPCARSSRPADIYPVFRELFKRRAAGDAYGTRP
jgi:uncharacterized protein